MRKHTFAAALETAGGACCFCFFSFFGAALVSAAESKHCQQFIARETENRTRRVVILRDAPLLWPYLNRIIGGCERSATGEACSRRRPGAPTPHTASAAGHILRARRAGIAIRRRGRAQLSRSGSGSDGRMAGSDSDRHWPQTAVVPVLSVH